MKASLDDRIARATQLASQHPAVSGLLSFYRELAIFQKPIYEALQVHPQTDVRPLTRYFPALLQLIQRIGPVQLAEFGQRELTNSAVQEELLINGWEGQRNGSSLEARFFSRVLLQPFAESVANRADLHVDIAAPSCPFCSAPPVVGVLRGEGDGAKRSLLCSLCGTEWEYRRVICPGCGEENKEKLPIFMADQFDYVRVDACDSCRTYIKSVDLTKQGHAVAVVDEIATVALSIWAEEHDYMKLEPNVLGM